MALLLENISTPTLLLDKVRCLRNIDRMMARAKQAGVELRPHFKTHQSIAIGEWFRARGLTKITVSSLAMAEYFAGAGWSDILVAFPVNVREKSRLQHLAKNIHLHLLVESSSELEILNSLLESQVSVWIKIDVGTGRTGIPSSEEAEIAQLMERISGLANLKLEGLLAHAGHSYKARGEAEIMAIHEDSTAQMRRLKARFSALYPQLRLSLGDTPTCSRAHTWADIDELRPGNFVFYDSMQWQIGACSLDDIAVAVACPVVAKHPERGELLLYAGAVHLSKDSIMLNGQPCFGLVTTLGPQGWSLPSPDNYLRALSQEHGIAKVNSNLLAEVSVGDLLAVLPVHSCLTADKLALYTDLDGHIYDHFNG